jgi:argininosuccinate lyase
MKGLPFRSAYKISGQLVAKCIREGKTLETLSLEEYREATPLADADLFDAIDLDACVARRTSLGGTSVGSVEQQIAFVRAALNEP